MSYTAHQCKRGAEVATARAAGAETDTERGRLPFRHRGFRASHRAGSRLDQRLQSPIAAWFADLALARYLKRRAAKRKATICQRRSDGSLWAATTPQNAGYAMRGLLSGKSSWHFAKVRIWRGLPIVSPKLFWAFNEFGKFDIVAKDAGAFWLSPWPEVIECAKIDAGAG